MTHVRRTALFGTILAVTCLTILFSAGSDALDRPTVDTKRSDTCSIIDRETLQNLPSGRTFEALAGVVPENATLEFSLNSKGKPTDTILVAGTNRWDFEKTRFNARDCSVKAEIPRAQFGTSGYSGCLEFTWHTQSEKRGYLRANKLRLNGGPIIRDEQLWFFKPTGAPGIGQPPAPEDVPVKPAPPSQPMESSGFKIPDGMLLNGTTLDLKISADYHANHEGHFFPSVGHYLCLRIPGNWQVSMNDVTENSFKLRLPSSDPRVFYEQLADCQRTSASAASCNWNGSVHGRDLSVRSDLRFLPGRGVGTNIFFGIGSDKFSASGAGTWK